MVLAFESNCKLDKHLGGRVSRLTDDFGAEFAAHSDSLPYRTIGIYVFLRHRLCSPVRSQIAHALKLSRYERRLDRTLLGAVGAHVLGAVSGCWHGYTYRSDPGASSSHCSAACQASTCGTSAKLPDPTHRSKAALAAAWSRRGSIASKSYRTRSRSRCLTSTTGRRCGRLQGMYRQGFARARSMQRDGPVPKSRPCGVGVALAWSFDRWLP